MIRNAGIWRNHICHVVWIGALLAFVCILGEGSESGSGFGRSRTNGYAVLQKSDGEGRIQKLGVSR